MLFPITLQMGQTSDPETLDIHQKVTPGNNPEDFKQHYDHGESLQLQNKASYTLRNVDQKSLKYFGIWC